MQAIEPQSLWRELSPASSSGRPTLETFFPYYIHSIILLDQCSTLFSTFKYKIDFELQELLCHKMYEFKVAIV